MSDVELVVRGRRVVTPRGTVAASVHVAGGRIARVSAYEDAPPGCPTVDAGDAVLLPGLVDTHVHVNDPGRSEWEGFETATRAAAAGGVTTLVDMPLNSIPATTTRAALERKVAAAFGRCWIDVGFSGGVVPGNARELDGLFDGGVVAVKCFLVDSGVPEFPPVGEDDLRLVMRALAERGVPLLVHAELPGPIDAAPAPAPGEARSYRAFMASRPRAAEDQAVSLVARLSGEYGARVHVVHLSSSDALPIIERARTGGAPLSAETCPHYLSFAAEEIADGATEFKCTPPIREAENRARLWSALDGGLIDLVVSDHSPCTPELKRGDFMTAWGGIASLQLGLAAVWTGARERGHTIEQVVEWMCAAPARLAGLDATKGAIAPGRDADLVIWDPDASWTVEGAKLEHKNKLTPYEGRALRGAVRATYSRGRMIHDARGFHGGPAGRVVRRGGR